MQHVKLINLELIPHEVKEYLENIKNKEVEILKNKVTNKSKE